MRGDSRFAAAGRTDQQRRAAPPNAAAEQQVEFGDAALDVALRVAQLAVGPGGELRKDDEAAALDFEVVESLDRGQPAHLQNPDAAPRPPVLERELIELDDAVGEALQLLVGFVGVV